MSLKQNTLVKVLMLQGEKGEKGDTGDIDNIDEMLEALQDVVYTKAEIDTDFYTKNETDAALENKANVSDVYTKAEIDTDFYTKNETDAALENKANVSDVYTKSETSQAIINAIKTTNYYLSSQTTIGPSGSASVTFITNATDINKVLGIVGVSTGMVLSYFEVDEEDITKIYSLVFNPMNGTHVIETSEYITVAYV